MSDTKFTNGPWMLTNDDFSDATLVTSEERVVDSIVAIATIETTYNGEIGDEQEANTHLIGCAPEMYELIETYMQGIKEADALLAKARGES